MTNNIGPTRVKTYGNGIEELARNMGISIDQFRSMLKIKRAEEGFIRDVLKAKRMGLGIEKIRHIRPVRSSIG